VLVKASEIKMCDAIAIMTDALEYKAAA